MKRKILHWTFATCFLSEFRWFRRFHGGKWMRTHVDHPVCALLWLDVPDNADASYREGLWRGTPEFEDWG